MTDATALVWSEPTALPLVEPVLAQGRLASEPRPPATAAPVAHLPACDAYGYGDDGHA